MTRRWAVAASAVVAVVAIALIVLNSLTGRPSQQRPAALRPTVVSTPESDRPATTGRSVAPTPVVETPTDGAGGYIRYAGHWRSAVVKDIDGGSTIISLDNDPYVLTASRLERISATSGHVVDRTRVAGIPRTALAAAGAIWLVARDDARLILTEYNANLHVVATTVLIRSAPHGLAVLMAASPDGRALFATDGQHIFRIGLDPLHATELDTPTITPIIGLAVGNGTPATLYLASGTTFHNIVHAYSVSGTRLHPVFAAAVGNVMEGASGGMAASSGGVWLATSTGNASSAGLLTDDGRTQTSATTALTHAAVQVVGNTAWISAFNTLICANGSTGLPIAATLTTPVDSQVQAVTADQRHAYAMGVPANHAHLELIRINLPASCRRTSR